jgi:hypothetical protein
MRAVSKWTPITDPLWLRRMGKTGEECAELVAVTTRITIQGIDEIDPSSGLPNRERLHHEIGDVYAQLDACVDMLGMDRAFIEARRARKLGYMQQWEAMFKPSAQDLGKETSHG